MPHSSRACAPCRVLERDQSLPHVAQLAITQQQAEMCARTDSTEPVERRRNTLRHRDVRASPRGKVASSTVLSVVGLRSLPQLEVLLLAAQGGLWKLIWWFVRQGEKTAAPPSILGEMQPHSHPVHCALRELSFFCSCYTLRAIGGAPTLTLNHHARLVIARFCKAIDCMEVMVVGVFGFKQEANAIPCILLNGQ